jgi:hypothetical protein
MYETQRNAAVRGTNAPAQVREIIVDADQAALNAALEYHDVAAERIISVILQPGAALAVGDHGAKYRVLYRAQGTGSPD